MATFVYKAICFLVIALVAAHGADARKLLQAVGQKSYSGDITAAASQTAANIQATVASAGKPGTATQAVKPDPLKPLSASSMSTVSDSRHNSPKSFVGSASAGSDTASQASKSAAISSYASGSKPAAKNTIKLSNVPNIAAQTPVGSTARGAGVSASLQAATASAINNRINAQVQVAAHNAMPGPNIPGPKP